MAYAIPRGVGARVPRVRSTTPIRGATEQRLMRARKYSYWAWSQRWDQVLACSARRYKLATARLNELNNPLGSHGC